jgi:hypothetical protein
MITVSDKPKTEHKNFKTASVKRAMLAFSLSQRYAVCILVFKKELSQGLLAICFDTAIAPCFLARI